MKKDLPENLVQDIGIAVVLESDSPQGRSWNVYLINLKDTPLQTVLISSKGYGLKDGVDVKTSVLRHSIGDIPAKTTARVEAIDEQVFGLTNEYLLSFYIGNEIYDKKYIFVPESIVETNMVRIPLLNKPGILIL
ncbi:MAG: hypothetical protein ACO1NU_01070 [Arcticibacter sp.]